MRYPYAVSNGKCARNCSAFSLVEIVIALGVIVIAFLGAIQTLVFSNSRAVLSRLRTNARAVVERNIEQALSQKFTSTVTPGILATTTSSGSTYDDDGNGDNKVNVVVQDGTNIVTVPGTLTRIVTSVANSNSADIRQITFSLSYSYRGKSYSYSSTTCRARD